jgi:HTH-type transcriptional regulator / antitoxin HigA
MDIRPIKNDADYDAAVADVERLMDATPGTADGDRLDVLATLVQAYEDAHWPIDPPDPIDAIQFRIDQTGLTRRDLERYIGPKGRVSEVLSRKRPLTLAMIRRLQAGLGIPAEILIRPSVRRRRRAA